MDINEFRQKINEHLNGTEVKKIAVIKESGNFIGELSDSDKTNLEQMKSTLSASPSKLLRALKGEIKNWLTTNELTENDLSSDIKTELEKMRANTTTVTEMRKAEDKVIQGIGTQGADKKLADLETQVNDYLKNKDQEKLTELKTILEEKISDNNIFIKNKAEQLLAKLKDQSKDKNQDQPFNWTPWLIGGG